MLGVKHLEEVIWMGLIAMETKLHTLLAEWKILML